MIISGGTIQAPSVDSGYAVYNSINGNQTGSVTIASPPAVIVGRLNNCAITP